MKWFVAVLVFESVIDGDSDHDPGVDVQYRLLRAHNPEAAFARALALGKAERHSYKNTTGQACTWEFRGLNDLQEVTDPLEDGAEIYGFVQRGAASEWVVSQDQLTAFQGGAPAP